MNVWKTIDQLKTCLCRELREAHNPVCECVHVYGNTRPPMDICWCDCDQSPGQGVAWVRLVAFEQGTRDRRAYSPREQVGQCGPVWTVTVELGVYRCVSLGQDGLPPAVSAREADARLLVEDAMALVRAVSCCLDDDVVDVTQIGRYTPVGPSGGGAGGTITITFSLD